MEYSTITEGMKVIPVAKSAHDDGQGLLRSEAWRRAQRIIQPYLYVQLKRNEGDDELVMLGTESDGRSGEWFEPSDFEKYDR